MEQLGSHWKVFREVWYFRIFIKSVEKSQFWLKSKNYKGHFTGRPLYIFDNMLPNFFKWVICQTKFVEYIKTHIMSSETFSRNSYRLSDNVEMWYIQTGHRWQYKRVHVLCMLDNKDYRHTLRICYIYCFFHNNNGFVKACLVIYYIFLSLHVTEKHVYINTQLIYANCFVRIWRSFQFGT